jgi:hypothetical protein
MACSHPSARVKSVREASRSFVIGEVALLSAEEYTVHEVGVETKPGALQPGAAGSGNDSQGSCRCD